MKIPPPNTKCSKDERKNNWIAFPYNEDSVINVRFIRSELGLPTINKMFRRPDYDSDSEFEGAIESAALQGNAAGYNVYQCVNQINNDCQSNTVKENDIFSIDNLFIDIDRLGCSNSPATDKELEKLYRCVTAMVAYLKDLDWPEPTIVMSGNGYHIYYGLDGDALEPNGANRDLRRSVLECLAQKFDSSICKIDRCVYNDSRITKVLGMVARKGEDCRERPYRKVRLVSKPSIYYYVDNSMMHSLVAKLGCRRSLTKFQKKISSYSATPETPREIARLIEMLSYIDAYSERSVWLAVVWAVLSTGWSCAESIAKAWSKTAPDKYDQSDFEKVVSSYEEKHPQSYTLGTVHYHAVRGGWSE